MTINDKLAKLGVELVPAPVAKGSYAPVIVVDSFVFVSGMLPLVGDVIPVTGIVGDTVTPQQAQAAARQCMVNMFSRLATDLGSLDTIAQWVKLTGFVASTPEFTAQPTVMNTASDLVVEIFGDQGRHARSAVGVSALPLGTPVEIEAILRLKV
ncbi:MAG: RidA family protein [Ferrimicrobium sp.]|jgi:enamine deaminase RidA (YjgF/YER057c/UK114 family)|uniref:RidA family protein n=1 Tax=Ferrimicrobium acidiphilum TaxID=121039 RepID=A0ABV3Y4T4_9ACTN|nr:MULTISPECIES: RidA family protein [Ferrimicrobium]